MSTRLLWSMSETIFGRSVGLKVGKLVGRPDRSPTCPGTFCRTPFNGSILWHLGKKEHSHKVRPVIYGNIYFFMVILDDHL